MLYELHLPLVMRANKYVKGSVSLDFLLLFSHQSKMMILDQNNLLQIRIQANFWNGSGWRNIVRYSTLKLQKWKIFLFLIQIQDLLSFRIRFRLPSKVYGIGESGSATQLKWLKYLFIWSRTQGDIWIRYAPEVRLPAVNIIPRSRTPRSFFPNENISGKFGTIWNRGPEHLGAEHC